GTDATASAAVANDRGVSVGNGATGNTIGGTVLAARNVISANTNDGVELIDVGTTGNSVQGNYIGTNASGSAALANATGVHVDVGPNTIGGTAPGAGNLISGNGGGVFVQSLGVLIAGNLIGKIGRAHV